jgi:exo-beta-1,3-glucanase (GH17 family)
MNGKAKVFISYRHQDRWVARIIYDSLADAFRVENIFFDVHKLQIGHDYRAGINQALDQSEILIAIIGKDWLEALRSRQGNDKRDWVRYEIQRALELGLVIVPTLVDGGRMPEEAELPPELAQLAYAQAITIHQDVHLDASLTLLVQELRKLGLATAPRRAQFWDQYEGRKRGWIAAAAAIALWCCLFIGWEWWPPPNIDRAALGHLLYSNCWVSYDPVGMSLDEAYQPVYPPSTNIARELRIIREAGFSGVLTFSAKGTMVEIPRLAQGQGLKVIMGVWNPADRQELSAAIRQSEFVDAYCVGHNGLSDRYSIWQLKQAIYLIKKRTGLPATTTEPALRYDAELATMGDWLFPDAHITLKNDPAVLAANVDLERDIQQFMTATKEVSRLAQRAGQPLILKNVAYPHQGPVGGSRDNQAEFYRRVLEWLNDPQQGHTAKAAIVAQGAFDAPWKLEKPFHDWDKYTGLILLDQSNEGEPTNRPASKNLLSSAGQAILRWYPHLKAAKASAPGE